MKNMTLKYKKKKEFCMGRSVTFLMAFLFVIGWTSLGICGNIGPVLINSYTIEKDGSTSTLIITCGTTDYTMTLIEGSKMQEYILAKLASLNFYWIYSTGIVYNPNHISINYDGTKIIGIKFFDGQPALNYGDGVHNYLNGYTSYTGILWYIEFITIDGDDYLRINYHGRGPTVPEPFPYKIPEEYDQEFEFMVARLLTWPTSSASSDHQENINQKISITLPNLPVFIYDNQ